MTVRLSTVFGFSWGVPSLLVLSGAFDYEYVTWAQLAALLMIPLVAWVGMRVLERRFQSPHRYTWQTYSNAAVLFWMLIILGVLGNEFLAAGYSVSGIGVEGATAQQSYVDALEKQLAGELSTGALGTLGQLLRLAIPFALIVGVRLIYQSTSLSTKALVLSAMAASSYHSYMSTFSRGQLLFSLVCVAMALLMLPVPKRKLAGVAAVLVVCAGFFYAVSADQRIQALGLEPDQQLAILERVFETAPTSVSVYVGELSPAALGLVNYFTHSIPEAAKLLEAGQTPLLAGNMSFFSAKNAIGRLLGYETEIDLDSLERINVWYTMLGDLYIDFGLLGLWLFVPMMLLMHGLASLLREKGWWGDVHYILTAAFFALSPLYSVFYGFSLVYLISLFLATLNGSNRVNGLD